MDKPITDYGNQNVELSSELFPDFVPCEKIDANVDFANHFNTLLAAYPGKKIDLYKAALVSDRMFRHIKSGHHLRKEPILALLIAMGLNLENIQVALMQAGYILSHSMLNDAVIMWMLKNDASKQNSAGRLQTINDTLDSLGLPLLMTRMKE